jgi:hypothetical protein
MSSFRLADFEPGQVSTEQLVVAKQEALQRSLELLDEANVSRDALQRIHTLVDEQLLQSLSPTRTNLPPLKVVREDEVPTSIRSGKTNPWFVKTAPFDGWSWQLEWQTWGGKLTSHHNIEVLENPFTYISGQFGHYSCYENYDSGSFDGLWLRLLSEVGFWYKADQAGPRQVWVKIRCKKARADIYLDDEFGWSSSTTNMWSRLHINIVQIPGLELQSGYWSANVKGTPDSKWYHYDWIAPETILWLPFTANFPPGWVYIAIGAEDQRSTGVNDVDTNQTMNSQYAIEHVLIES